jgi:hypothetical protein
VPLIVLLPFLFAFMGESKPDFSGWWVLNLDKSTFRAQPPKDILVKIQHREPKLIQTILVVTASGEQQQTFTFDTGGVESTLSVAGGQGHSRAHWNGSELIIDSVLQAPSRMFNFSDHWSLSSDGQTLRMAHLDDDLAGQVAVLHRASSDIDARFKTPM